MRKSIYGVCMSAFLLLGTLPMKAQFNIGKAAGGTTKVLKSSHINRCRHGKIRKRVYCVDG